MFRPDTSGNTAACHAVPNIIPDTFAHAPSNSQANACADICTNFTPDAHTHSIPNAIPDAPNSCAYRVPYALPDTYANWYAVTAPHASANAVTSLQHCALQADMGCSKDTLCE